MGYSFNTPQGTESGFQKPQGGGDSVISPPLLAADFVLADTTMLSKASPTFAVTNKMTLRFTMRPDITTGIKYVVARFDGDSNNYQFWVRVDGDDLRVTVAATPGDTTTGNLWTPNFSAGTVYDCVVVYDGTESTAADRIKFYLDGSLQAVNTTTGTPPTSMISSAAPLVIGNRTIGGSGFDGWIQCLAISSSALSGDALTDAHIQQSHAARSSARQADWFSAWDLGEESDGTSPVQRDDSQGTNHLTDVNTVASVAV